MDSLARHVGLLGKTGVDKVTGVKGVIDSISFDLYGCVQCSLNTGLDKDGEKKRDPWLDVARIRVINKKRVMAVPNFAKGYIADGKKGASTKADRSSF